MKETLQITYPRAENLSDILAALERAAVAHAIDLRVDHDRMLAQYGCLWMIARCRVRLERLPEGEFSVRTWLRRPTAAISNRDFALTDAAGEFGAAVQSWVLADAAERKLLNLKNIPVLWELPAPAPERSETVRRIIMPKQMQPRAQWTVAPEEIDDNGHLNNVRYVRRAEALLPQPRLCLEISFDRECFVGETLTLETAQGEDFFVRGVKSGGDESFRARFF